MFNKFSRVVFVLTIGLWSLSEPAHGFMSMEAFLTEAKSGKMTTQTFNDTLNERARAGHPLAVAMISLSTSPAFYEKFPHIQSREVVRPTPDMAHPVWAMYFEALPPTWLSDSHFWGALLLEKSSSLSPQARKSCENEGALYHIFLSQKGDPPHPIGLSALQNREDFTPDFSKYIKLLNNDKFRKCHFQRTPETFQEKLEGEMIRCATEKGLSLLFEALSAYGTVSYEILDRIMDQNACAKSHPLLRAHAQFLKTFEVYSYFSRADGLLRDTTPREVKQEAYTHLSRLMAHHGAEIREPDTLTLLGRLSESLQHYSEALDYFGRAIEVEKSKIPREKTERIVTQYYVNLSTRLLPSSPGIELSPEEISPLIKQALSFVERHQDLRSLKIARDCLIVGMGRIDVNLSATASALRRIGSLPPSHINDKDPFTAHRLKIHQGSALVLQVENPENDSSKQTECYQLAMKSYEEGLLGFRETMEASSPSDHEARVQELSTYEKNHKHFLERFGHHLCHNLGVAVYNYSDSLWLPFIQLVRFNDKYPQVLSGTQKKALFHGWHELVYANITRATEEILLSPELIQYIHGGFPDLTPSLDEKANFAIVCCHQATYGKVDPSIQDQLRALAEPLFREILARTPYNACALYNYGLYCNRLGRHEEARALQERGAALGFPFSIQRLALDNYKRLPASPTEDTLKKVLDDLRAVKQDCPIATYYMAELFEKHKKDRDQAIELYKQALEQGLIDAAFALDALHPEAGSDQSAPRMVEQLPTTEEVLASLGSESDGDSSPDEDSPKAQAAPKKRREARPLLFVQRPAPGAVAAPEQRTKSLREIADPDLQKFVRGFLSTDPQDRQAIKSFDVAGLGTYLEKLGCIVERTGAVVKVVYLQEGRFIEGFSYHVYHSGNQENVDRGGLGKKIKGLIFAMGYTL